jgi:hypothetical protein
VDHRHERFLRLHSYDQLGCDRPLPAHAGRCEGRGASAALTAETMAGVAFEAWIHGHRIVQIIEVSPLQ